MAGWFEVDKNGLAAILERRGKFFAIAELLSNAWDAGASRVECSLAPIDGVPYVALEVLDNGEGFANLLDATTLFARSRRAKEPDKRGRFNLGEKLVLACCRSAEITSAGKCVKFTSAGVRTSVAVGHPPGTRFRGELRMTREEFADAVADMAGVIPPVPTLFNGSMLEAPKPLTTFDAKLPTEIGDAETGSLRRTIRTARVEVYEAGGAGSILEMGIPVVENDNGYHVNVLQKIPLNMERDNVTPAFLRALNVAVMNATHQHWTAEAAAAPWAQEAAGDARATPEAVRSVIEKRFGEHAVVATPNDPIANAQAAAAGFTVISGGALPSGVWANVRKHDLLVSAGRAFPSPTAEQRQNLNDALNVSGVCPLCGKASNAG